MVYEHQKIYITEQNKPKGKLFKLNTLYALEERLLKQLKTTRTEIVRIKNGS